MPDLCKYFCKRIIIVLLIIASYSCKQADYNFVLQRETDDSQAAISPFVSYLNITSFCQDSLGYMWIATLDGLNRYNGYEFVQYRHDTNDSTSLDNVFVYSLFIDSSHRLWIATATGVNRYDFATNRFVRYINPEIIGYTSFFEDHTGRIWVATFSGLAYIDVEYQTVRLLPGGPEQCSLVWEDKLNRLWAGTKGGRGLSLRRNGSWEYFPLPGNRSVNCIYKDSQNIWWLGTETGITLFDPLNGFFDEPPFPCSWDINFIEEIEPLKLLIGTNGQGMFLYDIVSRQLVHDEPRKLNPFHSVQALSCYVDKQNNIWTGTFDKGFFVWNKELDYFNTDHELNDRFQGKFITRITEDRHGNLWIATRYDGLFCYASQRKLISYQQQNPELFSDKNDFLESLFIDSQDRIWIGLANRLIVGRISSDGDILAPEYIPLRDVRMTKEDRHGNIWIGTRSGLFKVERRQSRIVPKSVSSSFGNVPDICIRSSGDVFVSAFETGLFRIRENDATIYTVKIPPEAEKIAGRCVTLFEDSKQRLWMGSYGNGMACLSEKGCMIFTRDDGLPNNNVLCFCEDLQGDIWMSTSYGISKLRFSDTTLTNYFSNDGALGDQYFEKAGLLHSDGRIFFAGNHGLTSFNPIEVSPNKHAPKICIEDLKISNQSVKSKKGSVLTKSILLTNEITLNHKQSTISLDYAGIDYLLSDKLTYKYKMEGIDAKWNYVGNLRRISYSNLPPGKYTFHVTAVNRDGVESLRPATLSINVKPAPWFSWWAWSLYLFAFILFTFMLFRFYFKIKMNRRFLELEHNEREREREMSEMKITFFTNISHELRTPLTLISAPLEQLLSINISDENNTWLLKIISRNVQNMLRLINQLIDFRKMEDGILALQVQQTDLIQHIRDIMEIFVYPADRKNIAMPFHHHVPELYMWTDMDKLEKILHNLLSNALKYTPENGCVEIFTGELTGAVAAEKYPDQANLLQELPFVEITITDTGSGIPANKLNELFIRYRQIKNPSGNKPDYSGSGIGLYYTKRLVEKHKGKIRAEIKPDGGMVFSFILPLADIYSEQEKIPQTDVLPDDNSKNIPLPEENNEQKHPYCILIAEDNVELRDFIRNILSSKYRIREASNGETAWNMIQNNAIDLILSDVIMPGMSGYQLCSLVKENPEFCHIPVVLLTARSSINDQMEGLEHGADAYICKPFHVNHMLMVIKNQFINRDRLYQHFSTLQPNGKTSLPVPINEYDRKFMDKLTDLLNQRLSDQNLDIDLMSREMGFSRTGFYRKIKGLTNMAPIEFLNNYRLQQAAEMIIKHVPLIDIAEQTGFNSYSYFSKVFKKHYGMSPKEYQDS
ncbi:MAG: response regulator [Tannerella sp.]|jgi:signal transduction histidine kinase/ligand-binding sensor domain-containing protein/DNA-binding response OmpR family regulator|nr:response regulator [Tannerella sp.]